MELADQLCAMVRAHRVVWLRGRDDPEGRWREVEPHAVYIGSNDRGFVDFYQRAGWSKSGRLPGWRRLALSDVIDVRSNEATFVPRSDYRPENRAFYRAFVCTATDVQSGDAVMTPPDAVEVDDAVNP